MSILYYHFANKSLKPFISCSCVWLRKLPQDMTVIGWKSSPKLTYAFYIKPEQSTLKKNLSDFCAEFNYLIM